MITAVAAACGCVPPREHPSPAWQCPRCFTRYVQSVRWVAGQQRHMWTACRDDFQTFRQREDAAFRRFARRALFVLAVVFLVLSAAALWVVYRVTSS